MIQILCNKYDARALAFKVAYQSDIRATEAYENELENVYETTMSCNRSEAIRWLVNMMEDAISYGIKTQNRDWKEKFLAAYDVCREL